MRHPAFAARDAIGLEQPHLRPSQPEPQPDRLVDFFCRRNVVLDQPQGLAPDRLQKPIRDMRVDFGPHDQGAHAHTLQNLVCLGQNTGITTARDQFDQWQKVDRVEGMRDQKAFAPLNAFAQLRGFEPACR